MFAKRPVLRWFKAFLKPRVFTPRPQRDTKMYGMVLVAP